jgi:hypothetical protein
MTIVITSEFFEAFFIGFIVNVIIVLAFVFGVKKAYRIKPAKCAFDYLVQASVTYYQRSDTFIRKYTTKVRINRDNSGGR